MNLDIPHSPEVRKADYAYTSDPSLMSENQCNTTFVKSSHSLNIAPLYLTSQFRTGLTRSTSTMKAPTHPLFGMKSLSDEFTIASHLSNGQSEDKIILGMLKQLVTKC